MRLILVEKTTYPTVKESVYQILRGHGVNKVFGNPGSNELNFLKDFPEDFDYILCLHEGVAIGMAEGYAQATGLPGFVNLHAAAGTGNAMGALTNSVNSHAPLVVTAGQQARTMVYSDPLLKNSSAVMLPMPLVKDSYEPLSAQEVPHAISRALHLAMSPAKGPVYVSIPYDDWDQPIAHDALHLATRKVVHFGAPSLDELQPLLAALAKASNPVLVLGPEVDALRCNSKAALLADKLHAPVWIAPSAPRCPFPTNHHCFAGILPAGEASLAQKLHGHDLILVLGGPVFRYHQNDPGALLPENSQLFLVTGDAQEAARSPVGDAVVANVDAVLSCLIEHMTERAGDCPTFRKAIQRVEVDHSQLESSAIFDIVDAIAPRNTVYLNEATSTIATLWERVGMEEPGSYYFAAAGGLGFAMPAALGVKLADPKRPVVAFIGDGSAHYSISSLWTAARYQIPVVFIIINNSGYGALKWFSQQFKIQNVPGIEIDGVDFIQLSEGYGIAAHRVSTRAEFSQVFDNAIIGDVPVLIEATIERV
ncbi:benzoylformate decarboxylase [Halomonas sp. QHL1]|nr:benzoylformate decarboxylase [Halomonas sp. QHL1]